MTTIYSLTWKDESSPRGEAQAFFTSETKARKQGPIFAKQHNIEVVLEKWEIASQRDLPWLCHLMGTHDPETGQPYTSGVAEGDPVEISRWNP